MKMRYGKFLAAVLSFLILLSVSAFAVDEVGSLTYASAAATDPGVSIISNTKVPVFKAGESAVLEIPLRTTSIYTAFDVVGHITTSLDSLPFELENISPISKTIQIFFDIPTKITYDIYVPVNTVAGIYPIDLEISYGDMFGSTYSKTFTFYIKVENSSFDGSNLDYLVVSDYSVPETVERNTSFTAEIELKNMSGIKLNKTSVEIVLPSGVNVSNDTAIKGGAFATGDSVKFKYNLRVDKNADGGNFPVIFKVSVYDKDNTSIIQEFSFNSIITIPDDSYDYNPALEITDITVPSQVKPGEEFTVSVVYKNVGDCELKYIKTDIDANTSSDTFVNKTATSSLIQRLAVGESVTKEYTFTVSEKAKGDFYTLDFGAVAKYDKSSSEEGEITAKQYSGFYIVRETESTVPYTISDINIAPSAISGQEFSLTFNVTVNTYVETLKIEATLPSGIINTTPSVFWYDAAQQGTVLPIEIKLMCNEDATEGYANIKLGVSAQDKTEIYQYTGTYIEGDSASKPFYGISDITLPNSVNVADETEFDMTFTVTCLNADDEDVTVEVVLPTGIVNRSISKFYIGKMKKGESTTQTVKLFATDSAVDGFANIEIAVSSKNTEKLGQYTGLYVKNEVSSKDDIPVVIIDEYSYGGEYVNGGATFPLKLKFLNTSLVGSVKDLKITLASDEDGVFTPAASSNTYFIQSLAPAQSCEWNLDIQTKSDIQPQSYGLIINISYKNENGTAKSDVETLTIPVRQELRFNISDLPIFNDISMNEDAILSLNCANLGKSTVYNVLIKIQGNMSSTEYEIFAGNIEAGKGYSKTVYLTPMMEGLQEGTVTYQYEDADGVVMSEEKSFSFNAYSMDSGMTMMPIEDDYMMTEEPIEEESTLPTWFWYAVIGGGVAVIAVVTVIIVKVKKSKKDEDDED